MGSMLGHAWSRLAALECRIGLPARMINRTRSRRNCAGLRRFDALARCEESRVDHEPEPGQQHESSEPGEVFYESAQTPTETPHRVAQDPKERAQHDAAPEQNEAKAHVLVSLVLGVPTGVLPLGIRCPANSWRPAQLYLGHGRQAGTAAATELLIG